MVKIGEVARQTGLTIRTLRHYDSIGLLQPSERSESGYRLYTFRDIERLARILALRALGLPLEEIRGVLDDPRFSLAECLRFHLGHLDNEIERQRQARERLSSVLERFESSPALSIEDLTKTLEVIRMFEKYYTPDQLEELRRRRETIGEERIQQVQREWADVFAGFRTAMERGLAPSSPEVQVLATRSKELIAEFTGGDPGIEDSLRSLYRHEGVEPINRHGHQVDQELWEYMGRATQAAHGQ
jgi:DNA-binding transcriptional MerR regulator